MLVVCLCVCTCLLSLGGGGVLSVCPSSVRSSSLGTGEAVGSALVSVICPNVMDWFSACFSACSSTTLLRRRKQRKGWGYEESLVGCYLQKPKPKSLFTQMTSKTSIKMVYHGIGGKQKKINEMRTRQEVEAWCAWSSSVTWLTIGYQVTWCNASTGVTVMLPCNLLCYLSFTCCSVLTWWAWCQGVGWRGAQSPPHTDWH